MPILPALGGKELGLEEKMNASEPAIKDRHWEMAKLCW